MIRQYKETFFLLAVATVLAVGLSRAYAGDCEKSAPIDTIVFVQEELKC